MTATRRLDAIRKHEANVDLWIALEKFRNNRHDVQAPENHWRRDHEIAFGRSVFTRRSTLGFSNFLENAPARGHV